MWWGSLSTGVNVVLLANLAPHARQGHTVLEGLCSKDLFQIFSQARRACTPAAHCRRTPWLTLPSTCKSHSPATSGPWQKIVYPAHTRLAPKAVNDGKPCGHMARITASKAWYIMSTSRQGPCDLCVFECRASSQSHTLSVRRGKGEH